jgi:hypothetical protein
MNARYESAENLQPGDLLPNVGAEPHTIRGYAEVASMAELPSGALRISFARPVHSRWMPGTILEGITFMPGDRVIVGAP